MAKKLNWYEYWIGHCWMRGWESIRSSYRIWADLLGGNYEGYALLKDDDPYTECYEWFWASLGADDTLPKDFLEYLYQMADDVETGKVESLLYNFEDLEELKDLLAVSLSEYSSAKSLPLTGDK